MTALLLATFVSLQAAQARPATAAAFQPRPTVRIQPAGGVRSADDREIICGMVVVRTTPEADAKILLPSRETGAAIRRIQPRACTSRTKDQEK